MSFAGTNPSVTTPGIYRLVSPGVTGGVKNGTVNGNITFVTNIPSLDFAIRIWRTRWWNAFAAYLDAGTAEADVQLAAQLTENQTKTVVLGTDTSYLDNFNYSLIREFATAAGFNYPPTPAGLEVIHDFNPVTSPWSVATKLNLVTSIVTGSFSNAGTVWAPFVAIEYTLERLTADLRDYLAKRLQIQGS